MLRMKRIFCSALVLLVAVSLLPLPAAAAGFWEKAPVQEWEGVWTGLLGWFGLLPEPSATTPGLVTGAYSSFIDPLGQPNGTLDGNAPDSSAMIDPNGNP